MTRIQEIAILRHVLETERSEAAAVLSRLVVSYEKITDLEKEMRERFQTHAEDMIINSDADTKL